jgi:hypothetical protein
MLTGTKVKRCSPHAQTPAGDSPFGTGRVRTGLCFFLRSQELMQRQEHVMHLKRLLKVVTHT